MDRVFGAAASFVQVGMHDGKLMPTAVNSR